MKKLMELWKLWAMFLSMGVEPGEEPAEEPAEEPGVEPGEEPAEEPAEEPGEEPGKEPGEEPGEEPRQSRSANAIREARRRAQEAEENLRRTREELDAMRRGPPGKTPASEEETLRAQEDAHLETMRADADAYRTEKWRIDANRTTRAARSDAAAARAEVREMSDRADFREACRDNPRLKAVQQEVEKELQRMRSQGQNAPREGIAYYLLGKKVASAKAAAKKNPSGEERQVPRGNTPGARSDVRRGGGGKTEREKREARLIGKPI